MVERGFRIPPLLTTGACVWCQLLPLRGSPDCTWRLYEHLTLRRLVAAQIATAPSSSYGSTNSPGTRNYRTSSAPRAGTSSCLTRRTSSPLITSARSSRRRAASEILATFGDRIVPFPRRIEMSPFVNGVLLEPALKNASESGIRPSSHRTLPVLLYGLMSVVLRASTVTLAQPTSALRDGTIPILLTEGRGSRRW